MVTIGVKLYVGSLSDVMIGSDTAATITDLNSTTVNTFAVAANTQIVGVKTIPQLQSAPNAIDVTSLEDTEEQSEPGLISGSSLQIVLNYKENVFKRSEDTNSDYQDGSNFEQCLDLSQDDTVRIWKIVLPNGRYFLFLGKARTVAGEMQVASALTFTLSLFKRSKVYTGMVKAVSEAGVESQSISDVSLVKAAPITPIINDVSEESEVTEEVAVDES